MNTEVIDTIVEQLGGAGLASTVIYVGTSKLIVQDEYTLALKVNGRRGFKTLIVIHLTPMDTYTITLEEWRGTERKYFIQEESVYCDELRLVIEDMYDDNMRQRNDGQIPLGA